MIFEAQMNRLLAADFGVDFSGAEGQQPFDDQMTRYDDERIMKALDERFLKECDADREEVIKQN